MKAKGIFWTNHDEVEKAEKLSLRDVPKREFKARDFYFDMNAVSHFYLSDTKDIIIYINGMDWAIEWNEEIWNKLVSQFS